MTYDYEACRENLRKLAEWYAPRVAHRNEATTRIQLIDRLFFECLGWPRDSVIAEEAHNGKFTDYTFIAPRRVLIVEAKKEGEYFELPAGHTSRVEYGLTGLMKDNPRLAAAIRQASDYCQSRGVPFSAVSNGHQIAAFVATRSDGVSPFDGKALVFHSLDFMYQHFLDLWQGLSKPGIEEKRLIARLIGDARPDIPPKPSAALMRYPGVKGRNIFQTDLQTVSELVLEDLPRSPELEEQFLTECYSESGALSQYELVSKDILKARYAALFQSSSSTTVGIPAVEKRGISSDLLAESLSRRPVLLIGDVGVGKTMFIRRLMKISDVDLFAKAIALYIDLGSQGTLASQLKTFIPGEIIRQLRESYDIDVEEARFVRAVYSVDLSRFVKSIYGDLRTTNPSLYYEKEVEFIEQRLTDRNEHIKQSLHHVVYGRKQQVIIFLDNSDQRSEEVQQEAFLIAQELAAHWPAAVFVSLRPETYYRSLKIGAVGAYHPKAFTIAPPRIDRVIEKRVEFAARITRGEIPVPALNAISMRLRSLSVILAVFQESLRENAELIECIENIAAGNVRLALDLVRGFLGSGHVDTEKIARIYDDERRYVIPLHEFLRAVIYGDNEYFDPNRSAVANMFDVSTADPKEHFLLPIAVSLVNSPGPVAIGEGFAETSGIYERLQALGFTPEQIDDALLRGYRKGLIEAGTRRLPEAGQPMPEAIRVTSVGLYHVKVLCRLFTYIDAVIVDTPIFDSDARREALQSAKTIRERLDRAELFREYLDRRWAWVGTQEVPFEWEAMSELLRQDIARIRTRLPAVRR